MTYNTEIYIEVGLATGISEAESEFVCSLHLGLIPENQRVLFAIGCESREYIVCRSVLNIDTLTQEIYLKPI
jgi:hypothetical protein